MASNLQKEIHNVLAYPFAWEKCDLGDLPVERVAEYVADRTAHLTLFIEETIATEVERRLGDLLEVQRAILTEDREPLPAGAVVGGRVEVRHSEGCLRSPPDWKCVCDPETVVRVNDDAERA